jgi:hypothetical protein
MSDIRKVYLNPKQELLLNSFIREKKKIAAGVLGRGFGKSTAGGEYLDRCQSTMPRSRGLIGGPTMSAVMNRILPSVQEHWERLGLIEDQDYKIGKKPPSDWDTPKSKVNDWKNFIAWPNGCAMGLVSFYGEGGARGGSNQFGYFDEMGWVKRENFSANVGPTMRGMLFDVARLLIDAEDIDEIVVPFGTVEINGMDYEWIIPFSANPFYMSTMIVSSMPWTERGKWILEFESNPEAFFIEGTALDNIDVLGPLYIPNQQSLLTDLEFRVEIMNERLEQTDDSFYHAWSDEKHITETDPYRRDVALEISFDFGQFMCIVVNQYIDGKACTIRIFYVKNGSIGDLLDQFIQYYQAHPVREIRIDGDVQGNLSRNPEVDMRSLYEEIQDILVAHKWVPSHLPRRYNPAHSEKHLILNKALAGKRADGLPLVRIYREGCQPLIMSIKKADAKGALQKDKSSEHPKSGVEQEQATHLSDAWDYWYMSRFAHLHNVQSIGSGEIYLG